MYIQGDLFIYFVAPVFIIQSLVQLSLDVLPMLYMMTLDYGR